MTTDRRSIDSFSDHIITRQFGVRNGNWAAVLDTGINPYVSDPDFISYGASAADAANKCAFLIRRNAQGIGKYAPRQALEVGYDLHYRLMRHWEKKERFEAIGIDPNDMVKLARSLDDDLWTGRHLHFY